jgi:hypothetical protein
LTEPQRVAALELANCGDNRIRRPERGDKRLVRFGLTGLQKRNIGGCRSRRKNASIVSKLRHSSTDLV